MAVTDYFVQDPVQGTFLGANDHGKMDGVPKAKALSFGTVLAAEEAIAEHGDAFSGRCITFEDEVGTTYFVTRNPVVAALEERAHEMTEGAKFGPEEPAGE